MKDAQTPKDITLASLLSDLENGEFVIPDFQRDFEWQPQDIRDLIASIFRDYYVGSLLLWRGKKETFESLSCEPIAGYAGENSEPKHIVLDGQQRLSSLYYACFAPDIPAPNRKTRCVFFIRVDRFLEDDEEEAFIYDYGDKWVGLLSDRERQFEDHLFPLACLGKGSFKVANWAHEYIDYWTEKAEDPESDREAAVASVQRAERFKGLLQDLLDQYSIAYIELDKDLDVAKVCDIFTQVNSKGVQLDAFDLINAMTRPHGIKLKDMWRKAEPEINFSASARVNVYVLQVMSLLAQDYCSPKYLYYLIPGAIKPVMMADGTKDKQVLITTPEEFTASWQTGVESMAEAVKRLHNPNELGAIADRFVPYASMLSVLSALLERAKEEEIEAQPAAQGKIQKWYWASVFSSRYSGSVESTAARDFSEVQQWFGSTDSVPSALKDAGNQVRDLDLRRDIKPDTALYRGVFNLMILAGSRDWLTLKAPEYGEIDDHHIIPRDWGKKNGLGQKIDSILNRSPLTEKTNREIIGSSLPNEYIPKLIGQLGEEEANELFSSHLIPPKAIEILSREPFSPEDYEEFLLVRERRIREVIESYVSGDWIKLSAGDGVLADRARQVELSLREVIRPVVNQDLDDAPSHVAQKARERFEKAKKKRGNLDGSDLTLLDCCDLSELQDILLQKSQWENFQHLFSDKAVLQQRFAQLIEIRNCLAHHRPIDEVTRDEGKASLTWFETALENVPGDG